MGGSSIGQHLRHCLNHYHSFLKGLPHRAVDYDRREREGETERATGSAADRLESLRRQLKQAQGAADEPVRVKMNCGGVGEHWQWSIRGRELQLLLSHTVHHFAMIRAIAWKHGIALDDDFGVAPSTLAYRRTADAH